MLKAGHTERAQAAAPKNTVLYAVTITGHGRIPLYLGPGTTRLTMYDSRIKGRSNSVALYLDAESGFNIIRNNTFDIAGANREIIAVDGSANNQPLANAIRILKAHCLAIMLSALFSQRGYPRIKRT